MQLITQKVPDSWTLYDMGDLHVGAEAFHEDGFLEVREEILADRNARVLLGGDLIEAIAVDDFRYQDETTSEPDIDKQIEAVIDLLTPIKKRIIVSLEGNHEWKLRPKTNPAKRICKALGIPYGTYSCKVSYRDKHGLQFKQFTTHGAKKITSTADDPIRRYANEKLILKRHLKDMCGDAYLMTKHHNHRLILAEPEQMLFLTDDSRKVKQNYTHAKQNAKYIPPDLRFYGCAGSWMKLYGPMGTSGYAERFECGPVELGYLRFEIEDRQLVKGEGIVV